MLREKRPLSCLGLVDTDDGGPEKPRLSLWDLGDDGHPAESDNVRRQWRKRGNRSCTKQLLEKRSRGCRLERETQQSPFLDRLAPSFGCQVLCRNASSEGRSLLGMNLHRNHTRIVKMCRRNVRAGSRCPAAEYRVLADQSMSTFSSTLHLCQEVNPAPTVSNTYSQNVELSMYFGSVRCTLLTHIRERKPVP